VKGPPPSRANSNASYFDPLYECTGTTCSSYIFVNGIRVAKKIGTTVTYFHKDHISSTGIETDANGGNAQYCRYKPYGEIHSCSGGDKYKFTDQEYDSELGLYNYGAREYDPALTRFMSADTIVPDPADPQTLNRHSYCRNNPVMYVDPSGHLFGIDDLTIGVLAYGMLKGALIGAGIGAGVSAATGGDVGQGALTGAIGGAIFGGAGEIVHALRAAGGITSATKAGIHAAAGAMSGGINAGITGGDIGAGMLSGGLAAGISAYVGAEWLPKNDAIQIGGRVLLGAAIGGVTSAALGGSFGQGALVGGSVALLGELLNDLQETQKNEKEAMAQRHQQCLAVSWDVFVQEMFYPGATSFMTQGGEAFSTYWHGRAWQHAAQRGLIYPLKSSISRGFVAFSRVTFWGSWALSGFYAATMSTYIYQQCMGPYANYALRPDFPVE